MTNLKVLLLVLIPFTILIASVANAEMSSTNYRITSTVMSGGGIVMSSTNFSLMSTVGQSSSIGNSSSPSYGIDSGFWYTLLVDTVGDINGDGFVNLEDVIAALQVVTGQPPATIIKEADADDDGKIGLSEALFILRKLGY